MLQFFDLPVLHLGESGDRAGLEVEFGQRLIGPVHNDLSRAALVAFLRNHAGELGLFDRRHDNDILSLLNLSAFRGDQTRIFSENRFFHTLFPPSGRTD